MNPTLSLSISSTGEIDYLRQPFLWAAFWGHHHAVPKIQRHDAVQIPYPFIFGNAQYGPGNWLVKAPDATFSIMSDADYKAKFVDGPDPKLTGVVLVDGLGNVLDQVA